MCRRQVLACLKNKFGKTCTCGKVNDAFDGEPLHKSCSAFVISTYVCTPLCRNLGHQLSGCPTGRGRHQRDTSIFFLPWQSRGAVDLLVSDAVLAEVQIGDDEAVRNRLVYCNTPAFLDMHPDVEALATYLLQTKALPAKAFTDAVHIAIAALHEIRFIASWRFRHIVGAVARRNIEMALAQAGSSIPLIATPEEILESLRWKNSDPVMKEVWQAKETNAKKFKNLAADLAYLRQQAKCIHGGGRVACQHGATDAT